MGIIEEAEQFKQKEIESSVVERAKMMEMPNIDLKFIDILRFFDITSAEAMKTKETIRKIKIIYEYLKDSEDVLADLRKISSDLGNPVELQEKLDKIYSHIHSLSLEKKFEKEKIARDQKTTELFAQKAHDFLLKAEEMKKREEVEARREAERMRQENIAKRKEAYLKAKKEKVIQEAMAEIEKTKAPESPEVPKIKI